MIHLHTLGDTLITVGEKEVRPSAPLVFAALLYLSVERGRRVPRAALRELFFPESDERSGSHSVRQLLYKLRQLGASVSTDDSSILLSDETADSMSDQGLETASNDALRSGFLPSYEPTISRPFSEWLYFQRDRQNPRIAAALLRRTNSALDAADHANAHDAAMALLAHDPLNEEATLVRAKCLALTGQKQRALDILEAYSAEVNAELRLPAESLRRRIVASSRFDKEVSLVGRAYELQQLVANYRRSFTRTTTASLIWGEAGIGKTRLIQEVGALATLEGSIVVWAHCQEHTSEQPLGVLIEFVDELLRCRGALGVSPSSMRWLKRLEARTDIDGSSDGTSASERAHQVKTAIIDLIASIACESSLVLIVEDAQWIDDASRDLLLSQLPSDARIHLLMTSRNERLARFTLLTSDRGVTCKLAPLSRQDSARFFDAALPAASDLTASLIDMCITLAAGNALFLRTLALHVGAVGDMPKAQSSIPDLMRQRIHLLSPTSLLLLRLIAAFATSGTIERVRRSLEMSEVELMLSLQDLADRGFVIAHDQILRGSHQILIDTVLDDTPVALRQSLYEKAAVQLEGEGNGSREASLMWTCAEFWSRSGNKQRAALALRRCATFAVEVGQPEYGIPALERAHELSNPSDTLDILELTITIADLATDDEAVVRNVAKYRRAAPASGDGLLHSVDLAEIRARRRLGFDVWEDRERLIKCALSPQLPLANRRRAARTYLTSAEESFGAEDVWSRADALSHLWDAEDEALDALGLRMLFHLLMGDLSIARQAATRMRERIEEYPMLTRPLILNSIARTLSASGATAESLRVSEEDLSIATKISVGSDIAMACARLADTYLTIGDLDRSRHWADKTEQYASCNPYSHAYHLTNKILLAIALDHLDDARQALDVLKSFGEATKPHAVRSIIGFELLLHNAATGLSSIELDFDRLLAIDDLAGHHSEHLWFATGLFVALSSVGQAEYAAARFGSYLNRRRRERYDPWPTISVAGVSETQFSALQQAASATSNDQPTAFPKSPYCAVGSAPVAFGQQLGRGFLIDTESF